MNACTTFFRQSVTAVCVMCWLSVACAKEEAGLESLQELVTQWQQGIAAGDLATLLPLYVSADQAKVAQALPFVKTGQATLPFAAEMVDGRWLMRGDDIQLPDPPLPPQSAEARTPELQTVAQVELSVANAPPAMPVPVLAQSVDIDLGAFDFKIQNCSLANLMTATTMAGDRLLKLPPISWLSKIEIPKPVLKVLVFLVFLWVANKAYDLWSAQVADELRAMKKIQELQVDDPAIRWPQAVAEFARSRVHPGLDGLRVVRKSLGQLPLHWKGWKLGSANCKAQPPAAGQQVWDCSASYTPEAKSGAGTNADLKASIPEGFDIKFESMQQVSLEWKPSYKAEPLNLNKLSTRNQHLLETASQLQTLLPAMSSAPSVSFTSSGVSPPKSNSGADIPKPANMVLPSEATLNVGGPLRTIDTLIDRGIAAEWRSLSLTYAAMSGPVTTLLDSALQIQISGVLYAKD